METLNKENSSQEANAIESENPKVLSLEGMIYL